MPGGYKTKTLQTQMPEDFPKETVDTICRIDANHEVIGVMYLEKSLLTMCTVPDNMSQSLTVKLPVITEALQRALGEIDILDDLVSFRIETRTVEILVTPAGQNIACAVIKVHSKKRKQKKR